MLVKQRNQYSLISLISIDYDLEISFLLNCVLLVSRKKIEN